MHVTLYLLLIPPSFVLNVLNTYIKLILNKLKPYLLFRSVRGIFLMFYVI